MHTQLLGFLGATLALASAAFGGERAPLKLVFGVYQTDKATVMYKRFTPVLEALSESTGKALGAPVDIHLEIQGSYEGAVGALCGGKVDFMHMGPASYVMAKRVEPRIQILAMELENGQKRSSGVVFVAVASPIQTLDDLRGKRFAFGDPNSTVGRYLVQDVLVKANVHAPDLAHFAYHERHDQVASLVEMGDFDAGAVKISTFEKANKKGALRVIASFDNVTKPWATRPGLDEAVFKALQAGLFALDDPTLLAEFKVSGFVKASDEDYDIVRVGMKAAEQFEKPRGDTHR